MASQYTVLIPPTRVTQDEADFINQFRREHRITMSEALRQCINALRADGNEINITPYGASVTKLPGFLVDANTNAYLIEMKYKLDISRCQVIRAAIDCMKREQEVTA